MSNTLRTKLLTKLKAANTMAAFSLFMHSTPGLLHTAATSTVTLRKCNDRKKDAPTMKPYITPAAHAQKV